MTTAAAVLTSGSPNSSAPVEAGNGNASAAPSLPTAPSTGWWDTVKDAEVKTWLSTKKYPDAESALKSHWSLERLMGADKAGRTVMLPKDENDADGWKALSAKLGVPDTADGYKLPMPQGTDDGFAKTAAKWFHEAGVPPRAANKIAEAWNTWVADQVKSGQTADLAESEKQMADLKQQWGGEYDGKRELAQRGYREFAKQFGLDDKAALERAESVLGAANLTKFFAGIGAMNSESGFAGSDGSGGGFSGVSKEAALKELRQIQSDRMSGKITNFQWEKEYGPKVEQLGKIAYS